MHPLLSRVQFRGKSLVCFRRSQKGWGQPVVAVDLTTLLLTSSNAACSSLKSQLSTAPSSKAPPSTCFIDGPSQHAAMHRSASIESKQDTAAGTVGYPPNRYLFHRVWLDPRLVYTLHLGPSSGASSAIFRLKVPNEAWLGRDGSPRSTRGIRDVLSRGI